MAEANPVTLTIRRDGDALAWTLTNRSDTDLWAYVLIPTEVDGQPAFATDHAWAGQDGETVLFRLVQPERDPELDAEPINVGALRIAAGQAHSGAIAVGAKVPLDYPWEVHAARFATPTQVALEVGWIPVREGQPARLRTWNAIDFAYLNPSREPGGQRIARSTTLTW